MEGAGGAAGGFDGVRITADLADGVAFDRTVPDMIELAGLEEAGDGPAAVDRVIKGDALFVCPHDDFERVPGRDAESIQRLDGFDRGQHTEIAIEIAAIGDGIDVRTEQDGFEIAPGSGAAA